MGVVDFLTGFVGEAEVALFFREEVADGVVTGLVVPGFLLAPVTPTFLVVEDAGGGLEAPVVVAGRVLFNLFVSVVVVVPAGGVLPDTADLDDVVSLVGFAPTPLLVVGVFFVAAAAAVVVLDFVVVEVAGLVVAAFVFSVVVGGSFVDDVLVVVVVDVGFLVTEEVEGVLPAATPDFLVVLEVLVFDNTGALVDVVVVLEEVESGFVGDLEDTVLAAVLFVDGVSFDKLALLLAVLLVVEAEDGFFAPAAPTVLLGTVVVRVTVVLETLFETLDVVLETVVVFLAPEMAGDGFLVIVDFVVVVDDFFVKDGFPVVEDFFVFVSLFLATSSLSVFGEVPSRDGSVISTV